MTWAEFSEQMARLVAQFGKTSYSDERLKLLYRELRGTNPRVWERVVDILLGEARYAPMLPDIREHLSRERERLHAIEKAQHSQDAQGFWQAVSQDEAGYFFGNMRRRLEGSLSEQDFNAFVKTLKNFRNKGTSV